MTENNHEDEPLEEDLSFDEEISFEEDEDEKAIEAQEEILEEAPSSLTSLEELPVALTVEVGKITLTADKLMQLEPGNLLELKESSATIVYLTLNGKRVGRAELLQIGDVLGVRIIELG